MTYAKYVSASSRSGEGNKTKICIIPAEFGEIPYVRELGTAGEVDRTSDTKRLIPRMLCLLTACLNCPVATLYELSKE